MSNIPKSRVESILQSKIDGTTYDKPPQSRVEELLLELDTGGGGGGTKDYNELINKPTINGHELSGDMSADDLDLEEKPDNTYIPGSETVVIGGHSSGNTYNPDSETVVIGG